MEEEIKIAIIAGAAKALKYKEEHPRATDRDVLRKVALEIPEILENINHRFQ